MENIGNKPGFVLLGSVSVKKGEEKLKKKNFTYESVKKGN